MKKFIGLNEISENTIKDLKEREAYYQQLLDSKDVQFKDILEHAIKDVRKRITELDENK